MPPEPTKRPNLLKRQRLATGATLLVLAAAALYGLTHFGVTNHGSSDVSSQARKRVNRYTPTSAEWASLTVEPAPKRTFRAETVTEGKIAVDEDRSKPVFPPYASTVT